MKTNTKTKNRKNVKNSVSTGTSGVCIRKYRKMNGNDTDIDSICALPDKKLPFYVIRDEISQDELIAEYTMVIDKNSLVIDIDTIKAVDASGSAERYVVVSYYQFRQPCTILYLSETYVPESKSQDGDIYTTEKIKLYADSKKNIKWERIN